MGRAAKNQEKFDRKIRPALTPEGRESQLISLAIDRAEQQLLDGTASSQVITHYLKLGSMREKLEMEKLKRENELLQAKTENLQAMKSMEEKYEKAIKAMQAYKGYSEESEKDPYDEY